MRAERFQTADVNGDGMISYDEFEAHTDEERARRQAERSKHMFAKLDADGDGYISATEHTTAGDKRMEKRFDKIDTNGDGSITPDEMEAAKAARKGKRGERKERGKDKRPVAE